MVGGQTALKAGDDGVRIWKDCRTDVGISFAVNYPEIAVYLASVKRSGDFVVTALSTDGGSIPRNKTVELGLAMVRFGALSVDEFAFKASAASAKMFGLSRKGHLGTGADADVTVLDLEQGTAVMAIAGGQITMINGVVVGRGTRFLTTPAGATYFSEHNCEYQVVEGVDANDESTSRSA